MNFPIMLKAFDSNGEVEYYVALNSAMFICDDRSKIIMHGIDPISDNFDTLISTSGEKISIESLNCSSYEELLVKLQLHNLLHGVF